MKISLLLTAIILFVGCSTVPLTGRKQLDMVPDSQLLPMSFASYEAVISSSAMSTDQQQVAMIKRVGDKIKTAVETFLAEKGMSDRLQGFDWEFNLIANDTLVNAWAMPGGKVAFYTGIMPVCLDEAGVAVVMGHEVAHAIAGHGGERMSQQLVIQLGMSSLSQAMGSNPSLTENIFLQSVGYGGQLGMLKFSRTHESEADKLGLMFMAIAGYDPGVAPAFWQRMAALSGGAAPPEWLSTHPSNQTRIDDLNADMPAAKEYYEASQNN